MAPGTVYWITGLSGAGKTTIGKLFSERIRSLKPNVVFLDGDNLREVFGNDLGYTIEDRLKLAMSYSRLCKVLSDQGLEVVCATISMFRQCHRWNRVNINHYREVYLRVPIDVLISRDQKQLYSRALKGEVTNVMGISIEIEEPANPHITIDNDGSRSPRDIANYLFDNLLMQTKNISLGDKEIGTFGLLP